MKWFDRLRTRRAAVLGCGPAGMFAAHGLIQKGWEVRIFSKKRPSEMFGAQYLHSPIPGLTESDAVGLHYVLHGSVDGYRTKVYGPASSETVSVQSLLGLHQAWDIREAYRNAWERYSHLVRDIFVDPRFLGAGSDTEGGEFLGLSWDVVINTIPLKSLCYQSHHQFEAASVWALGHAPERGQSVLVDVPHNTVICSGEDFTGWYRASNVFGYATVEWPASRKPPLPGVAEVVKPISNNCTCYPYLNMVKLGRYGAWEKGFLSHQAYEKAVAL